MHTSVIIVPKVVVNTIRHSHKIVEIVVMIGWRRTTNRWWWRRWSTGRCSRLLARRWRAAPPILLWFIAISKWLIETISIARSWPLTIASTAIAVAFTSWWWAWGAILRPTHFRQWLQLVSKIQISLIWFFANKRQLSWIQSNNK